MSRVRTGWGLKGRVGALGLATLLVVGGGLAPAFAEPTGATIEDRRITLAVNNFMRDGHITRQMLNDEIAGRMLNNFLKTLDAQKAYFYQSDIDEFELQKDQLDDQILRGNVDFAFQVYARFLQRFDERVAIVDKLLVTPFDFTVDEEFARDPDAAKYPTTPDEAYDLWRRKIKYDLLVLKANEKLEGQEARDKLSRRYHSLQKRMHQMKNHDLLEWYLTAMTTAYDPHSTYMSPTTQENFEIIMRLNLQGIGAQLQYDDGYTIVNKVIPGGAADKDGRLKKKDRIVGVGQGKDGPIEDVIDLSLNETVERIRGDKGTIVRLQIIPFGSTEKQIIDITRSQIELKESEAQSEVVTQQRDGKTYKIGFIRLPSFYMDMEGARLGLPNYKSTTRDVENILEKFRAERVDAVVLDLRFNGGGSLTEAINLTGLFIDEGPVVRVKDKDGKSQTYKDSERGTKWDGPLVVLCNKFSASASEIFAGAIQDYHRGLVVGDPQTHGKGTVQSLLDLGRQLFPIPNAPSLGALKLTMQQFYRPNADSTQNLGVQSDIVLPSITAELEVGESDLDFALPFEHLDIDTTDFKPVNDVDPALVARLRELSKERCDQNAEFKKVMARAERYRTLKDNKTVSLNEEKFMALVNADKEGGDLENEIEEEMNEDRPVVKKDFYFDEAMNVTLDYLRMKTAPAAAAIGNAPVANP